MAACHRLKRLVYLKKCSDNCRCLLKPLTQTSDPRRNFTDKTMQTQDSSSSRFQQMTVKASYSTENRGKHRPTVDHTMDEQELANFTKLASSWWDETGDFEALHAMNKLRIPFIRDALLNQRMESPGNRSLPLEGMKIVDAGSGGGLIAEPLARLGAFVIGVDPVEESTKIAQLHLEEDPVIVPRVKYITGSVEDLVPTEAEQFDAVVSSEVIEHVADLKQFIDSCCKLVKPCGSLFVTTINKTELARATAVFGAEQILKIVPPGTHDWNKFVPPEDLQYILDKAGLLTRVIHGMLYNPLTREWKWIKDTTVNYALHAVKADTSHSHETVSSYSSYSHETQKPPS